MHEKAQNERVESSRIATMLFLRCTAVVISKAILWLIIPKLQ